MTPEVALREAAATIGQMPEAVIQRKYARLQEARQARVMLPGVPAAEIAVMRDAAAAFAGRFSAARSPGQFGRLAGPFAPAAPEGRAYCMHCSACNSHHITSSATAPLPGRRDSYVVIHGVHLIE
jgi:hypothetical protein